MKIINNKVQFFLIIVFFNHFFVFFMIVWIGGHARIFKVSFYFEVKKIILEKWLTKLFIF